MQSDTPIPRDIVPPRIIASAHLPHIARIISYGNSAQLSVCLSRPGTDSSPSKINLRLSPYDSLEYLVFRKKKFMPLGKEDPHKRERERGAPLFPKTLFYRFWLV